MSHAGRTQAACNRCALPPTDPSLAFLPTTTSEELFIFITGYKEAVIPCRVTDPHLQVTLFEKKVENPIPAAYDPQQGFKGFFEDKTYYCQTIVDDQEVDSDMSTGSRVSCPYLGIPAYLLWLFLQTNRGGTEKLPPSLLIPDQFGG